MKVGSKILLGVTLFLVVLSVSATFYKTVILQDFDMTGVYVEFPTEDSSYVWFVYDNEEYELELETANYDEIVTAVAGELGIEVSELDADFLEYLASAYHEGEVVGTEEEIAEEVAEEDIETIDSEEIGDKETFEATPPEQDEATTAETTVDSEAIIEMQL